MPTQTPGELGRTRRIIKQPHDLFLHAKPVTMPMSNTSLLTPIPTSIPDPTHRAPARCKHSINNRGLPAGG